MDSILTSIKKLLGIADEYTVFDNDIMLHINSVLSILVQMGVGTAGIKVTSKAQTWVQFIPEHGADFGAVVSYVYLKVKLLFDPPSSSAILESINNMIKEFEFRLNVMFDVEET